MTVKERQDGTFALEDLSIEDLGAMKEMITCAKLPERRHFNSILEALKKALNHEGKKSS